ncbi:hypothetical protein NQ176_g6606 [Zarea fungicola]|uniref:Uncharacterized protein n=1 Tax=Zarea fungicola TaxID=93591 RepID=A0ACC1N2D7_9HYPO|nr:hypothetical protein NQ176_g6606 [Lecanicillium fungicola]
MSTTALRGIEILGCDFVVPNEEAIVAEILPRWSELHIGRPAIIISPRTEQDIAAAINLAKLNNLKVIPAGGRHACFVAIDETSLVLDMSLFNTIQLNKENGSVQIGAGVLTRELIRELAGEGYYTTLPGSNAVGVVGALLGGGITHCTGLHGYMSDNALSFRVITAAGEAVDVGADSSGEERRLFDTLRGAGHGLAVVTDVLMKAYPVSKLELTEGKVWSRTLIFPPPALEDVQKLFFDLHPVSEKLNAQISFVRSPPNTPFPGTPLIILSVSYYGSATDAERDTRELFDESFCSKAVKVDTSLVPLANVNDALEAINACGGLKSTNAARLKNLRKDAITKSFAAWFKITESIEDSKRTAVVFHSFNPASATAAGAGTGKHFDFVEGRDRGFAVTVSTWCMKPESHLELANLAENLVKTCQEGDGSVGIKLPNSMRLNENPTDLFGPDRLAHLRLVKKHWDEDDLFWTPHSGSKE